MIGIYKITNPLGKIYIGQSINIIKRWKDYKSRPCKRQIRLNRSFLKYGILNHSFEIIEKCNEKELNNKERYWQDYYDATNKEKGLNCRLTKTNDKSGKLSCETKLKISIAKSHTSDSTRLKMSKSQKGNSNSKGKITSESTKLKLSIINKGKTQSIETINKKSDGQKKIILDKQTGIFYFGAKEASEALGLKLCTMQSRLKRKSAISNLIYV